MGLVLMNERELHRVGVLAEMYSGDRTVASGAALLGLTALMCDGLSSGMPDLARPDWRMVRAGVLRTSVSR